MAIHKVSVSWKRWGDIFQEKLQIRFENPPPFVQSSKHTSNKVKGSYWQLGTLIFILSCKRAIYFYFPSPVCFENLEMALKNADFYLPLKHLNICQHAIELGSNILNWQQPAGAAGQWSLLVHLLPNILQFPPLFMSPISPLFSCLLFVFEFMILDTETEKDHKSSQALQALDFGSSVQWILHYELDCHQP